MPKLTDVPRAEFRPEDVKATIFRRSEAKEREPATKLTDIPRAADRNVSGIKSGLMHLFGKQ